MQYEESLPFVRVDEGELVKTKKFALLISNFHSTSRIFKQLCRQIFFIFFYLLWALILQFCTHPRIIFFVYGTKNDKKNYWPSWLEKYLLPIFPVGILRREEKWGWIIATPLTIEQLEADGGKKLIELLTIIKNKFPSVKSCALAGRLPGVLRRNNIVIKEPFVDGGIGTRYTIYQAVLKAAEGKEFENLTVAVLGGRGYTGGSVVKDLSFGSFKLVIGVDPRYGAEPSLPTRKNQCYVTTPSKISNADIVVILTAKGDEAESIIPFLKPGAIVLDDTHPCITKKVREQMLQKGAVLLKVTVQDGELRTIPRLPNFRSDDIPGCLTEAVGILLYGWDVIGSLSCFSRIMQEKFQVNLSFHPDDS